MYGLTIRRSRLWPGPRATTRACRSRELGLAQRAPGREARAVAEEARAADGDPLAVRDVVEERGPGRVDQPHAAADEQQRPRVRVAAGLRVGDVDDDADARLDELLGG